MNTQFAQQLDRLCTVLEEELERHENILSVCRSQQQAIVAGDHRALDTLTASLEILLRESARSESARLQSIEPVAQQLAIASPRPSLQDIASASPEPWRGRLDFFRNRLRETVDDIQSTVRLNARLTGNIAQSLRRILANAYPEASYASVNYDRRAIERLNGHAPAVLLDTRG